MRRLWIAAIAVAVLLFLAISALLARAFSADGAERSAIASLIEAEARGDVSGVIRQLDGCAQSDSCRARATADATALKHAGTVSILQLEPSTGFSLTSTVGTARVAWNAGGSLPIVQCVRVRRAGDVLSGLTIELLQISVKLRGDATCPSRF